MSRRGLRRRAQGQLLLGTGAVPDRTAFPIDTSAGPFKARPPKQNAHGHRHNGDQEQAEGQQEDFHTPRIVLGPALWQGPLGPLAWGQTDAGQLAPGGPLPKSNAGIADAGRPAGPVSPPNAARAPAAAVRLLAPMSAFQERSRFQARPGQPTGLPSPAGGLLAGIGLTLLLATGCRSLSATEYNLRVLHEPDGGLAPRSATAAHWYYGWLDLTGPAPSVENPAGKPRVLSRPRQKIRRETLRLVRARPRDSAERAEQLALASFLAHLDRSPVVRELALDLIAAWLEELELSELPLAPAEPPNNQQIDGARGRLGLASGALASGDLSALDLAATRQLLEELSQQLRGSRDSAQQQAALRELAQRTVGLTLRAAVNDPQDWVRSRAARLVLPIDDSLVQSLMETALETEQPLTIQALCEFLAQTGKLPAGLEPEAWRERLIAAVDYPDDRASVAAARALSRIYPEAGESLRPEDWLLWWEQSRRPAAQAEASGDGETEPADQGAAEALPRGQP